MKNITCMLYVPVVSTFSFGTTVSQLPNLINKYDKFSINLEQFIGIINEVKQVTHAFSSR